MDRCLPLASGGVMRVRTSTIDPRLEWTKESAPCCRRLVDDLFRPVIGFCGPDCVRRREPMRRIEEMRLVLQLACLTEDRDNSEHKAMLSLAKNLDKEANAQTTANMLLRDQPYTECTFRDGPPQSHSTKGDACKCAGSGGSMPVRIPPGGWWRLVDLVEDTRAVVE